MRQPGDRAPGSHPRTLTVAAGPPPAPTGAVSGLTSSLALRSALLLVRGLGAELRGVLSRFAQDQGFLLAAALSFGFLLCLTPLVLILFSIAGFLLDSEQIAEYVFDSATLLVPPYAREVAEFLNLLTKERAVTGVLGAVGLVVFATQLFSLTRSVVNRAFRVRRRRFLHGFAFDLVAVVGVGSLTMAIAVAVVVLAGLGDLALRLSPMPLPPALSGRRVFSLPVIYATGVALLFVVYRTFPNTAVPARAAGVATVAVTVLWELARRLFAAYVTGFGIHGRLYGPLGIGVASLVWLYYSATIFVLGAEVAAALTARASAKGVAALSDPGPPALDPEQGPG